MAEIKKIPSGLWQAIVVLPIKLPSGRPKRITKTHPLRRVVADWSLQLESAIASGTWLDPKASQVTLTEWRERWVASRIADNATAKKNESHWRNHVEPVWGGYPLSLITRGELKTWVHQMHTETCPTCRQRPGTRAASSRDRSLVLVKHKTPAGRDCAGTAKAPGLGAWTIQGVFAHLSGMLAAAVDEGLLPANPGAGMTLPKTARKPVFFWTKTEASQILLHVGGSDAIAVELDLYAGLRPGELFGLRRTYIDTDSWLIHVYGVATRTGWRAWAKSSKSHRAAPVPPHMRDRFLAYLLTIGPDDIVFPAPGGGLWDDRNFARRVFDPAVKAAGVRRGTVYDMRHTAASWLVQRGVPLLDVQALLGHEKYSTTLIYAHLQPGAFGNVLDAWDDGGLDLRSVPSSSPRPHAVLEQQEGPVSGDPGNGA